MKRKNNLIWIAICIVIIVLVLIGAWMIKNRNKDNDNEIIEKTENEPIQKGEIPKEPTLEEKIDKQIENMSLRDKIGQMIVVSYRTLEYNDDLDNILKTVKPGGFILFGENISTYEHVSEYVKKIKATADIPMMISIDQEGGRVQRIKNLSDANALEIPSMYTLGKTKNKELAKNVGKVMASELVPFGINTEYAPCLDIFSNPNNKVIGQRAFGSDSQTVIDMAIPFSRGMEEAGIIPVYKHFPGHGDTDADSHVELPVVNKTKEELYQNELLPFKAAIEEGAQMIMVAHIALPKVTGNYVPATLSKEIVGGILREELGFNGVVITDAVEMKALADNYSQEDICKMTIDAGVDIILMPQDPIKAVSTIENLVNEGTITEERIDESVKRILLVKYKNKLNEEKVLDKNSIGSQEHIDIINQIQ